MNVYYFYVTLLLLVFILLYYGISYSLKFAPLKIKILSLSALSLICLRYAALIILLFSPNIKNLYLLKPFTFLNLLTIPVLASAAIYILFRNDKIKFNYCLILAGVLFSCYIFLISKFSVNIEIFRNLGYIMYFNNKNIQYGIYLILNTLFLFTAIIFIENKNINKLGVRMIIASSAAVIIETLLEASGITLFPTVLFGDILWIITIDYALSKLRK
jgi:hypothetical protein